MKKNLKQLLEEAIIKQLRPLVYRSRPWVSRLKDLFVMWRIIFVLAIISSIAFFILVSFKLISLNIYNQFNIGTEFYTIKGLDTIVGLVSFPLAIFGLWLLNRRTSATEKQVENTNKQITLGNKGHNNERYQKGAEMLGSKIMTVRLGGIYALSALAKQQPNDYHIIIMKIFCAFVRNPPYMDELGQAHPVEKNIDNKNSEKNNETQGSKSNDIEIESIEPRQDVQEILTFIGRRFGRNFMRRFKDDNDEIKKIETDERYILDIRKADLRGADLVGANLEEAILRGAKLSIADLRYTNLSRANLDYAELEGAKLERANLSGASLFMADLRGARLERANLSGANLWRADLSKIIIVTRIFLPNRVSSDDSSDIKYLDKLLCKAKTLYGVKLPPGISYEKIDNPKDDKRWRIFKTPKIKTKSKAKSKAKTKTRPKTKPKAKTKAKSKSKAKPKTNPKSSQ